MEGFTAPVDDRVGVDLSLAARAAQLAQKSERSTGTGVPVLNCRLREERYAIDLRLLRSVVRVHDLTLVPCTPPVVAGVVSVRGEVITVLDLAIMLGLHDLPSRGAGAQVVLASHERTQVGLLVDEVVGIGRLLIDELALPLSSSGFVRGIDADGVISLDLAALLTGGRFEVAEEVL